jgi:hypothetical protein
MTNATRRRPTAGSTPDLALADPAAVTFRSPGVLVLLMVLIAAAVLVAHWPVLSTAATTLDDDQYWRHNELDRKSVV